MVCRTQPAFFARGLSRLAKARKLPREVAGQLCVIKDIAPIRPHTLQQGRKGEQRKQHCCILKYFFALDELAHCFIEDFWLLPVSPEARFWQDFELGTGDQGREALAGVGAGAAAAV